MQILPSINIKWMRILIVLHVNEAKAAYLTTGGIIVDEETAWSNFVQTGSVLDYLEYRALCIHRQQVKPAQAAPPMHQIRPESEDKACSLTQTDW